MGALVRTASEDGVPEKILEKLRAKGSFDKAKAEAQEHLEKALEIADKFPKNTFTEEIVAMFSSMSDRGN
jgi:octaprenyl-diphosphate synthase